jgi:hypothetical protein
MITDYYEPDVIEVTDTENNLVELIEKAKACYHDDSGLWGENTSTIKVRDRLKVLDAMIARIKSGIDDAEYIPGFVSRVEIQGNLKCWSDLLGQEQVEAVNELQERGESLA